MTRKVMLLSLALLLNGVSPSPAKADVDRQQFSHLTFTGAFQLPGATLPQGTYTFERIAPRVVQVRSADHKTLYGTFMTLPTLGTGRLTRSEVVFGEAPAGQAPPVKVWYPFPVTEWSSNHLGVGYEFVY